MNTQKLQYENCIKNQTKYHSIQVLFAITLNMIFMRSRKINKHLFYLAILLRLDQNVTRILYQN